MVKPWRILESRQVVSDRWIDLRADRCLTPGGREIAPYYVLNYPDWVHVVAVAGEQLVLVEQYRHGKGATCLELPGGVMEASDSDPIATAQRELLEESGYAAAEWRLVSSIHTDPAKMTNRFHTVLAIGCHRVASPKLETGEEGLTVRCMPIADVVPRLADGLIAPMMQVGALLLALSALGRIDLR